MKLFSYVNFYFVLLVGRGKERGEIERERGRITKIWISHSVISNR